MSFLSVSYRETISRPAEGRGKYVRQGANEYKYADTTLRVEPLVRGTGVEFINEAAVDQVPAGFVPDVMQGVIETIEEGIVAGFPLTDLRIKLIDGTFHAKHSTPLSFRIAASIALREAVLQAAPIILAPVARIDMQGPKGMITDVASNVKRMRGVILQVQSSELENSSLVAVCPLHRLIEAPPFQFDDWGRLIQNGVACFAWGSRFRIQFSHYEEASPELQARLVRDAQQAEQA